jgi:hypothetical protein
MKIKRKERKNLVNLVDQNFGRLKVIKFYKKTERGCRFWLCRCSCGKTCIVSTSGLRSGNNLSCGCLKAELDLTFGIIHGLSKTRIYSIWRNMLSRCYNKNTPYYKYYGGRGIKVCDRWLEFLNFYDDINASYEKHVKNFGTENTSLDRLNVNGNYEPSNCKWATDEQQGIHKRITPQTIDLEQHRFWQQKLATILCRYVREERDSNLFVKYFGTSLLEFKKHIESQFLPGMTWRNRGRCKVGVKVWQFGHIKDCNTFDLSKEEDRLKCFHYTNLEPQWWEDNNKKRILR